jgi:tetratricopeptide (TPR) repeat protein
MLLIRRTILSAIILILTLIIPAYTLGTHLISKSYPLGETSSAIEERIQWQTVKIINYDWRGKKISHGVGVFVDRTGMVVTAIDVLDRGFYAEAITVTGDSYLVEYIVSADKTSGLVLVQLEAVPDNFQYVEAVSAFPVQGEKIVLTAIGTDENLRIVREVVTGLDHVPVYSCFLHIELSQPIFEKGYPIFNGQGELSGITVVGVEGEKKSAIVVSGRKILSLKRDDESTGTHAEWTESEQFSWRESPTGIYLRGLANYMTGRYYQARPLLENAVASGKGLSEELFYYLGNCYESDNLHGLAIKAYNNALKFNPSSARVYENLAWSSMKAGIPGDALEACYNAVINEREDKSRVYLLMASIRNSIGDFRAAVTAAHGALNYDPDCACAYNEMGIAYNGLGMYDEAVEALIKATSLDPQYSEAFNSLGHAYLRSGRFFHAIVVLKHAATIRPEYSYALKNLGEAYSSAGLRQKALGAYRTAIGVCPDDPSTFSRLASEYIKSGDFQEAAKIYRSAVKILPRSAWLHYKLGRVYCRTGKMTAALDEYELLNQLNPHLADQLLIWIEKRGNS